MPARTKAKPAQLSFSFAIMFVVVQYHGQYLTGHRIAKNDW